MDEVVNYVRAMNRGLARLPDLPVSVRLIREIHADLMHGVRGERLHPRRAAQQPELDWPARLHADHRDIRAATPSRGAGSTRGA